MAARPPDKPILYAKVGGPPANWRSLEVRFAQNGKRVPDVREANAHEGWYVQAVRGPDGRLQKNARGDAVLTRKVHKPIKITRRTKP